MFWTLEDEPPTLAALWKTIQDWWWKTSERLLSWVNDGVTPYLTQESTVVGIVGVVVCVLIGLLTVTSYRKKKESQVQNVGGTDSGKPALPQAGDSSQAGALVGETKSRDPDVNKVGINTPIGAAAITPFLSACLSGNISLVRHMLDNGADVQSVTCKGDTALYLAVHGCEDNVELLKLLVSKGCSVNARNMEGFAPLHQATVRGSRNLVEYLLSAGAQPNVPSNEGILPVDIAVNEGHRDLIDLLQGPLAAPRSTRNTARSIRPKSL